MASASTVVVHHHQPNHQYHHNDHHNDANQVGALQSAARQGLVDARAAAHRDLQVDHHCDVKSSCRQVNSLSKFVRLGAAQPLLSLTKKTAIFFQFLQNFAFWWYRSGSGENQLASTNQRSARFASGPPTVLQGDGYMMRMRTRKNLNMLISTLVFVLFMTSIFHSVVQKIVFLSKATISQCNGDQNAKQYNCSKLDFTPIGFLQLHFFSMLFYHPKLSNFIKLSFSIKEILHTTVCRSNFSKLALERIMRLSNNFSPPPRPNLGNCTSVKY